MQIQTLVVEFSDNNIARRDTPKMRGYIASKFQEYVELHHHTDEGFLYQYPMVQYKTIGGKPLIIGIGEGTDIVREIEPKLTEMDISGEKQVIYEKRIRYGFHDFGVIKGLYTYKFVTPWMALNQNNYNTYVSADEDGRIDLLKRILIGNILSLCKAVGYHVDETINVMLQVSPITVDFKDQKMLAFKGSFLANFDIPDYIGIGKSSARGFGTIMKEKGKGYR